MNPNTRIKNLETLCKDLESVCEEQEAKLKITVEALNSIAYSKTKADKLIATQALKEIA